MRATDLAENDPTTYADVHESLAILLLHYSEWLDVNGLVKSPKQSGDPRTHEQLVKAFQAGHGRVVE